MSRSSTMQLASLAILVVSAALADGQEKVGSEPPDGWAAAASRSSTMSRLPAIENEISPFLQRNQVPGGSPTIHTPHERPIRLYEAVLWSATYSQLIRTIDGGTAVTIGDITTLDPEIVAQQIEAAVARFDPTISANYLQSKIDQPPDSFFGPGIGTQTQRDEVDFMARISKIWATGATTSVGYEPPLAYLFFPQGVSSSFNPIYSSDLVFELRQPLLRGRGIQPNLAPVQIARNRLGQSSLELQTGLQAQLRSIEQAYWQLHAARVQFQAIEQAIPFAERSVEIQELRIQEERVTYADVARAAVKLEDLRQQKLLAANLVQQRDLQLRQLAGFPLDHGPALVPIDSPVSAPPAIRLGELVETALQRRPDLQRRRIGVAIRDELVVFARNNRLPQLDARARHRASGLADNLDDSFTQMSTFNYTDWTLGLTFTTPLGNRRTTAELHAAELEAARERAVLVGYETQVGFELASLVASLQAEYERFQSAMRQVEYAQKWLRLARIRYEDPPRQSRSQDSLLLALYDYQVAIQQHIDAISRAAESLAIYNAGLARIEEARGTMLDRWQISTSGSGIPVMAPNSAPPVDVAPPAPSVAEPLPAPAPAPAPARATPTIRDPFLQPSRIPPLE